MHVRIVLVEPRDAGNVGAAARAMKNFGFTDLWIAGAGAAPAHPAAQYARPGALRGNRLLRRQESGPHVRGAASARGTGRAEDARGLAAAVVAPPDRALAREAVTAGHRAACR